MTVESDDSLMPQMSVRAEGEAQVNAVGRISSVRTLHVGNRYQNRCQLTPPVVEHIDYIPDNRDLSTWTDRTGAQAELLQRIEDAQTLLIELVAAGGFGKSAMAVWLSEQIESEDRQVIWVKLSQAATFSAFAQWVLYELCVPTEDTMPEAFLTQQLVRCLRKSDCLLVIDQLELIAQTVEKPFFEAFLAEWQRKQRGGTVLVTTRQRFLPQDDLCFQLTGFTPSEGAAFLSKKAVSTSLDNGLSRLSEICNGHPLLLNLSAAWLEKTTENGLDKDGLDFFEKLFKDDLDNPEAQAEEIFDRLLDELPETLRLVLLKASVYRIPIGLEMARTVHPEVTTAGLDSLAAQGFLIGQDGHWRLHPLVDQFVRERRQADGLEADAHRKAIEYFMLQLQQENRSIQDYLECFHHYCECLNYEAAYDVIHGCYSWLNLNGNYRTIVSIYERLATAWQIVPAITLSSQKKRGVILSRLATAYYSQGDYAKSIDFHQQSLKIEREIGDRQSIAGSLVDLGNVYYSQGDYAQAIASYQQSLEIQREIGDRRGIANSLIGLGIAYDSQNDHAQAITFYQQSLEIQREIGDSKSIAAALGNLGIAYYSQGDYARSIDFSQQSLEIQRKLGDRKGASISLLSLGTAYYLQGNYAKSIDLRQQSLEIQREIGDRNGTAASLFNLGSAYTKIGEYRKARDSYEQAKKIFKAIKLTHMVEKCTQALDGADSFTYLGVMNYSQGNYAKAIDLYQQSLNIQREIGNLRGIANALGNLGNTYATIGESQKAQDSYVKAKKIFAELNLTQMVEHCEKAIQEHNRIREQAMPSASPARSNTPSSHRKSSLPQWLPYLAIAAAITLLILLLQ